MNTALCYFLIYFAEALIFIQYISNVFSKSYPRLKTYTATTAAYIILFLISFTHNPYVNSITFFILHIALLCIFIHATPLSSIFHALILTVIMLLTEIIVLAFFSNISLRYYSEIYRYQNTILISIFSKLLYFFITFVISHIISKNKNRNISLSFKEGIFLCAIPVFSMWIAFTFMALCLTTPLSRTLDVMIILSTFFILLIDIIILGLYEYIRQKNSEIAELKLQSQRDADSAEYYKMLVKQDEKQKVLIHDIKKHLNAISSLNDQHDFEKISLYLKHLLGSSVLQHSVRVCDNDLLNTLLCRYQEICISQKINLHLDIRSKCIDFVTYDDLSVLFGNLMDNAVESAHKTTAPFIELNVFQQENTNMTIITLINSCRINPIDKNGDLLPTKKPNPQFHGFGFRSIQNVVNKYDGELTFYFDDPTKTFHMIIMMRISSNF